MKNSIKKAAKATLDFVKNHKIAVIGGTIATAFGVLGYVGYRYYREGMAEYRGEDIQVDIEENEIKDLKEEEKKTEEEE
jgi:hypothetical protein